MSMLGLVLLVLLLLFTTTTGSSIGWVSQPVRPGEVMVLQGSGLNATTCIYEVSALLPEGGRGGPSVSLTPIQPSPHSVKLKLPTAASLPMAVYNLTVSNCGETSSVVVNGPKVLWAQGDLGETASTTNGWVRVFGNTLSLSGGEARERTNEFYKLKSDLAKELETALRWKNFERAAAISTRLAAFDREREGEVGQTLLRLTGGGTSALFNSTTVGTDSVWSNTFDMSKGVPRPLPAGRYAVDVSNNDGLTWHPMQFFVSSDEPNRQYIDLVQVDSSPVGRIVVSDFGCSGTVECDSSAAVRAAVGEANKRSLLGQRTEIFFPRGVYYLTTSDDGIPPLLPNVSLRGEATDLVSVYFKEQQLRSQTDRFTNAPPSYISFNGTGPNGVSDITLYVTMFYNTVLKVDSGHSGFKMTRVRVRANAFHCMNGPHLVGRGGRIANYTWEQLGPVIQIHGANFEITDNDIYSTYNAIWTSGPGGRFGLIRGNRIWSGGAAHWFDQMKQIIFEYNQMTGISLMAMGNNIDTYGGGYAQNVFHAHNSFEQIWGNDREIMTTDNLGSYFAGKPVAVNATTITIPAKEGVGDGAELGGSVAILSGPGTGQYRRVIYYNQTQGIVKIDSPFCCGVDSTSFINIGPFRGNFIFHQNHYTDGGAFQLYSYAMNAVVSEMTMTRVGGILSWGRAVSGQYTSNLHNQFFNNIIDEGNHVYNYNGSYVYPHGKVVEPFSFGVLASDQFDEKLPETFPLNRFIVFRGNRVLNNGGLVVRGNTADVLAEGTIITNSSVGTEIGPAACEYSPGPTVPQNGCALYTLNSTILFT